MGAGPSTQTAAAKFDANIRGTVSFTHIGRKTVRVKGELTGLQAGLHGMHVHMYGDVGNACMAAGAHFDPDRESHGGRTGLHRHGGDLGNIQADSGGKASFEFEQRGLQLFGATGIVGRTLVIHADRDDLGLGVGKNRNESLKTGNSGARVACAIIGIR